MKRTTVSMSEDDYLVLEHEARRRGVPLAHLLREATVEYVAELRTHRKPRLGIANVPGNISQESVDDETSPARQRAERHGWL
ncbi:MAG: hypothetical protein M0R73_03675 [Dehalococcoidia bacterium]|nr:hypothetical protein [Dehalococcoidia bacterium]